MNLCSPFLFEKVKYLTVFNWELGKPHIPWFTEEEIKKKTFLV